ncbi:ABC transporter substrate-binding protein [Nocardioides sp.]|uniref:ABC transporter substrate-binding protein n=1 Tax=Nocardioides sp. TaxID=35761 RepID=UPI0031FE9D01|nr:transporter substrate-binding protein [Nocardioides sp.]
MTKSFHAARKLLAAATATLLVAAGVSACSANGAEGETKTIRYQSYTGMIDLPELADALGYLGDIKLDRVGDVQGGPESLRALATNQVDYGGAFNAAIAKVTATGVPITAVISYYGSSGDVNASVLAKEDGGPSTARDLIGGKVAVNTLGANAEAVLDTWFEKEGLTQDEIDQVTLVPLPGINTEAALREGQVDAAYMSGSLKQIALDKGGLKSLVSDIDLVGEYNGGSYVLRDNFIKDNPQTTKDFVAAVAKALNYSQTHSVDEVRAVMTKYLQAQGRDDSAAALALWKGNGVATKGGVIRDEDFTLWLDWLESSGEVDSGSIKPSEIYTNEFNPYAKEG